MSYKLTKSGLLKEGCETIILSDLINRYKKGKENYKSIDYDKETGVIKIEIGSRTYRIKLDSEQKLKFETGISDPQLNKIRGVMGYNDERLCKERTIAKAEDGELPVSSEGVSIYKKYLNKEILKSGAKIVGSFFITFWPLLLAGASVPFWLNIRRGDFLAFLMAFVAIGLDFGTIYAIYQKIGAMNQISDVVFLKTWKELATKIRVLLLKKADLKLHAKDLNNNEVSKEALDNHNSFVPKENLTQVIEYGDEILNEIQILINIISTLSKEEQHEYAQKIKGIIDFYRNQKLETINKADKSKDESKLNDEKLRTEMMTKINDMRNELNAILEKRKEEEKINSECDALLASVSDFDEWSDDLRPDGNVMKMS